MSSIFQDCYSNEDKFFQKIKYSICIQIVPKLSPRKLYPMIRMMQWANVHRHTLIKEYFHYKIFRKFKCCISPTAIIGRGIVIPHPMGIIIGNDVVIGDNVTIYQNVTLGQNHGKFPTIGNNVIIYANACIIGNVSVGDGAIIGANSVVTKNVPANAVVGGTPARVIKSRVANERYN